MASKLPIYEDGPYWVQVVKFGKSQTPTYEIFKTQGVASYKVGSIGVSFGMDRVRQAIERHREVQAKKQKNPLFTDAYEAGKSFAQTKASNKTPRFGSFGEWWKDKGSKLPETKYFSSGDAKDLWVKGVNSVMAKSSRNPSKSFENYVGMTPEEKRKYRASMKDIWKKEQAMERFGSLPKPMLDEDGTRILRTKSHLGRYKKAGLRVGRGSGPRKGPERLPNPSEKIVDVGHFLNLPKGKTFSTALAMRNYAKRYGISGLYVGSPASGKDKVYVASNEAPKGAKNPRLFSKAAHRQHKGGDSGDYHRFTVQGGPSQETRVTDSLKAAKALVAAMVKKAPHEWVTVYDTKLGTFPIEYKGEKAKEKNPLKATHHGLAYGDEWALVKGVWWRKPNARTQSTQVQEWSKPDQKVAQRMFKEWRVQPVGKPSVWPPPNHPQGEGKNPSLKSLGSSLLKKGKALVRSITPSGRRAKKFLKTAGEVFPSESRKANPEKVNVKIVGVPKDFAHQSFGRQLDSRKLIERFKAEAKHTHFDTKQISTASGFAKFKALHKPTEWYFVDRTSPMWKDDSIEVWYKTKQENPKLSILQRRDIQVATELKRLGVPTAKAKSLATELNNQWNSTVPMSAIQKVAERYIGAGTRKNPGTGADKLYKKFHGRSPSKTSTVIEREHVHGHLAQLGQLQELKILLNPTGPKSSQKLAVLKSSPSDAPRLCSNENGTQLYFVGGSQQINLSTLGFPAREQKEQTLVGQLEEITYRTQKGFDKFKTIDYFHGLGEVTGSKPMLVYKPRDKKMLIVGGRYKVKPEGIVD